MADLSNLTLSSVETAQALATLGADPTWDAALSDYLRLMALEKADYEFGDYADARDALDHCELNLQRKYGKAWRDDPTAFAQYETALARTNAAEAAFVNAYGKPAWGAARKLAETPAPALGAALFKVQMIRSDDLWNSDIGPQCMALVRQDMARLAADLNTSPAANRGNVADRRMLWGATMAQLTVAEQAMRSTRTDESATEFCDVEETALALPAPDLAAVSWKLGNLRATAAHSVLKPRDLDAVIMDVERLAAEL